MTPNTILPKTIALAAAAAACAWGAGCSISPKPEPPIDAVPALDAGLVTATPARDYGDPGGLKGGPGSASPPGAVVRVWNLEASSVPVDAVVEDDGSFLAPFDVMVGDEVRVQLLAGTQRSQPVDLVVGSDSGPALPAQHALGDCLVLEPPLEVVYPAAASVVITNSCSVDVALDAPVWRRAVAGVEAGQGTSWPATVGAGATLTVAIDVQPAAGQFEEIVFLRASSPQVDRRPVTVRGSAP